MITAARLRKPTIDWQQYPRAGAVMRYPELLFLLLLIFLVVLAPSPVVAKFVYLLQVASLKASLALFKFAGVPIIANGFVLSLPGLDIEIAEECSGIRSSTVLLIAGLVLQIRGLRSYWTKVLFVLSIVPLAVAKNAIRIFTLSVLTIYVSPDFLEGHLHHQGGVVFFLLALVILLLWLNILRRVEVAAAYWRRDPGASLMKASQEQTNHGRRT